MPKCFKTDTKLSMSQSLPTYVNLDVFKTEESKQSDNNDYQLESVRLESFKSWPYLSPEKLAATGFYYTGMVDKVKCFKCQVEISNWNLNVDPMARHKQWSPRCTFIRDISSTCDMPINVNTTKAGDVCGPYSSTELSHSASKLKHSRYATYDDRLASFVEWPQVLLCLKEKLAAAGLFYTGNSDRTVCYECGIDIGDWAVDDDPWEYHAKFSRICTYLLRTKGCEYVANVIQKTKKNSRQEISEVSTVTSNTSDERTKETSNTYSGSGSSQGIITKSTETSESSRTRKSSIIKISTPGGEGLCRYCYVRELEILFLPCSHLISCNKCAPKASKCVMCDTPVQRTIRPIC